MDWFFAYGTLIVGALATAGALYKEASEYINLSKKQGKLLLALMYLFTFFLLIAGIYQTHATRVQAYADKQLAQRDREQAQKDRQTLDDAKSRIDSLQGTVIQLQGAAISGLSTNLNTLTGANSFCWLGFVPGQQFLAFVHSGKFPLYGVQARITELDEQDHVKGSPFGVTISVGDMIRGHASTQPVPSGIAGSPDYFNANIFFTARNGDWVQLLREERVKDKWVRALQVRGRFTSFKKERILCETIDPEFPRKPNGTIDPDFLVPTAKVPRCQ